MQGDRTNNKALVTKEKRPKVSFEVPKDWQGSDMYIVWHSNVLIDKINVNKERFAVRPHKDLEPGLHRMMAYLTKDNKRSQEERVYFYVEERSQNDTMESQTGSKTVTLQKVGRQTSPEELQEKSSIRDMRIFNAKMCHPFAGDKSSVSHIGNSTWMWIVVVAILMLMCGYGIGYWNRHKRD